MSSSLQMGEIAMVSATALAHGAKSAVVNMQTDGFRRLRLRVKSNKDYAVAYALWDAPMVALTDGIPMTGKTGTNNASLGQGDIQDLDCGGYSNVAIQVQNTDGANPAAITIAGKFYDPN